MRELWSVATGGVNPWKKKSRQAAEFMAKQDGFVAVHPADIYHTLWLYDTENHAKSARNMANSKGIQCGDHICRFEWDEENNVANFADDRYKDEIEGAKE